MFDDNEQQVDWTNLPNGIDRDSLWECLHDAELFSICSDLLGRSVSLNFDVFYIREFHALPVDIRFVFRLDGVQSSPVLRYTKWPGNFSVPAGVSRDEEGRLIREFQAKWWEETASWSSVEASVTANTPIDISAAWLAVRGGNLALKLCGRDSSDEYLEFFLRAEKLDVIRSDGDRVGLAQFKKLGEAYWEEFAARSQKPRTSQNTG